MKFIDDSINKIYWNWVNMKVIDFKILVYMYFLELDLEWGNVLLEFLFFEIYLIIIIL